jgi:hypothetical protein
MLTEILTRKAQSQKQGAEETTNDEREMMNDE